MIIQERPDSLSLLGNLKHLVIEADSSESEIAIEVRSGVSPSSQQLPEFLVKRTYVPGGDSLIDVDLTDICNSKLAFTLRDVVEPYQQNHIAAHFSVQVSAAHTVQNINFTVLRGGVELLADSVENFLTQNFLTWQPNMLPVTYYTPEFLTYYAVRNCTVKCKAYVSGTQQTPWIEIPVTLATLTAGTCWTIPVGFQVIASKIQATPSYYDVWAEADGDRLTYIQRYYAAGVKSEDESWILFENSLGGIDTFRAYGSEELSAEHDHQVATIDDVSTEYRVDTKRKHKKSTGYLDRHERRWLLDFFPSLGKYVCEDSLIRRIVVTDSDTKYSSAELPSEYTFTYQYADAVPYLNLPRVDQRLLEMNIKVPDIGSFTIAPRLVEFPRLQLSEGALFPVQNPYSEEWGAVSLTTMAQYLSGEILALSELFGQSHFLSRLHDDVANGHITFMQGLTTLGVLTIGSYVRGLQGGKITADAVAELEELWVRATATIGDGTRHRDQEGREVPALAVKGDATFTDNLSSPEFVSSFLGGLGWAIQKKAFVNSAGVTEYKYTLEIDNAVFRNTLRVYSMIASQLLGENDNRVFSGCMEIDHYDAQSGTLYLKTGEGKLFNTFRVGDLVDVQQFNGMPDTTNDYYVTKAYSFRVKDAGIGSLADGENRLDWIKIENFTSQIPTLTPETAFQSGDTIVRMDSDTDPERKGIVTIMTVGQNMPYIDILYGLKTDPQHALKGRIGNLEGVRTDDFGWLKGFGIYTNNIYATGEFHDHQTGERLTARVDADREQLSSIYKETTWDINEADNLVGNGFFANGMDQWTPVLPDGSEAGTQGMSGILASDSVPILMNGQLITLKNVEQACVIEYDSLPMLKLNAMGVAQNFSAMGERPTHKEMVDDSGSTTRDVPDTLYMGIRILPVTEGELSVQFVKSSGSTTGWSRNINASLEWMLVQEQDTTQSPWDYSGNGRMILSYTGECLIRFVALTTDPVADSQLDYMTRITQAARQIKAEADAVYSTRTMHTELSLQVGLLSTEVTNNKDASDRALAALSGRVGSLETWESNTATWIYQTNSTINLWASQFDANGDIKRFTAVELDISNLRTTVTNNYNASESAFNALRSRADALETWESGTATWIYQTNSTINLWAANFNSDGSIKDLAQLRIDVNRISSTVGTLATTAAVEQLASSLGDRITAIDQENDTRASEYATWKSQTESQMTNIAAKWDRNGSLKELTNYSTTAQTAETIRNTVLSYGYATNTDLNRVIDNVSSLTQTASNINARVTAYETSKKSLNDPNGWVQGRFTDQNGDGVRAGYPVMTGSSNYHIRYANPIKVTEDSRFYISKNFVLQVIFINNSNGSCKTCPAQVGGGSALDIAVPSGASLAYLQVYKPGMNVAITPDEITNCGLMFTESNIVTEANLSLFIQDEISWLTGSADHIVFNFNKDFDLKSKNQSLLRVEVDANNNPHLYVRNSLLEFTTVETDTSGSAIVTTEVTNNITVSSLGMDYKAHYIGLPAGSADKIVDVSWTGGKTVIFHGSRSNGKVYMRLPSYGSIRDALGFASGANFVVEMDFINLSTYDYVYLKFSTSTGNNTTYPRLMSFDNDVNAAGEIQMGQGDFCKIKLVYNDSKYNAYAIIRKDGGYY